LHTGCIATTITGNTPLSGVRLRHASPTSRGSTA